MERAQVGGRERGDLLGAAGLRLAVAVRGAEDGLRQRVRRDGAGLVAGLEQVGERFLAQPLELGFREVRPQGHVRHQRERLVEPGDRDPQAHRRDVPRRAGADRRAQEVDRVGQRERVLAAGALVEHVGGHRRETLAAGGVGDGARAQHEDHLDHRHLVHADEHHADAVRQLEPLDGRQLERLHRTGLRRVAAVRLRQERRGGEQGGRDERRGAYGEPGAHFVTSATASSFLPSGTTEISTRPAPRNLKAAACTSLGASAR